MFGLGPLEILVILALALLVFGRRLPDVGRSVGKSIVEFKKGLAGIEDELRQNNADAAAPQQPSSPAQQPTVKTPPQIDAPVNTAAPHQAAAPQQPATQDNVGNTH